MDLTIDVEDYKLNVRAAVDYNTQRKNFSTQEFEFLTTMR